MKKLYTAALIYMIAGLSAGFAVRIYVDQIMKYEGETHLRLLHFHILVLGMIMMLVLMALEKTLQISKARRFNLFFWHYNGGLAMMIVMMTVIGVMQVQGREPSEMINGISGLSHIIITVGLGFLFNVLHERIHASS